MGLIKDMLKEELENSIRISAEYKEALKRSPGGSIIKKEIKGHDYYYLAFREGKKIRFIYKGKKISKDDLAEFKKSKHLRSKYKELIKRLNKRIKYLRKALRGKEDA